MRSFPVGLQGRYNTLVSGSYFFVWSRNKCLIFYTSFGLWFAVCRMTTAIYALGWHWYHVLRAEKNFSKFWTKRTTPPTPVQKCSRRLFFSIWRRNVMRDTLLLTWMIPLTVRHNLGQNDPWKAHHLGLIGSDAYIHVFHVLNPIYFIKNSGARSQGEATIQRYSGGMCS